MRRGAASRRSFEKIASESAVAEASRELELRKIALETEVARARAGAELTRELERIRSQEEARRADLAAEKAAREEKLALEREALRIRERLETSVRKVAEAERYRLETEAAGRQFAQTAEAAGRADALRVEGMAKAEVLVAQGEAEARVIAARAAAEAKMREAIGRADAAVLAARCAAIGDRGAALMLEDYLRALPEMVRALAEPLGKIGSITIVDSGRGEATGGAVSRLASDIVQAVDRLPKGIASAAGIDVEALLADAARGVFGRRDEGSGPQPLGGRVAGFPPRG